MTASPASAFNGPYCVYPAATVLRLLVAECAEDLEQVAHSRLVLGIEAHLAVGVGDRPLELAGDRRRIVEHLDHARRRSFDDLDIFDVGSWRSMIRAPTAGTTASGSDERVAEALVEAGGDVAGDLDVLALVVADRHLVGVVEQDVGGHQRRVGEQAGGDELAGPLAPTCP